MTEEEKKIEEAGGFPTVTTDAPALNQTTGSSQRTEQGKVETIDNEQRDVESTDTGKTSVEYDNLSPEHLYGIRDDYMRHYIDNEGGRVTLEEALGVDPERLEDYRKRQERLNDFKRKEAMWYNGLSVLGDALTAAFGGNVYKRDANNAAGDAAKANEQIAAERLADTGKVAAANRALMERAGKAADDFVAKVISSYKPSSTQTVEKSTNQNQTISRNSNQNQRRDIKVNERGETTAFGYAGKGGSGKKTKNTFYVDPKGTSTENIVNTQVGKKRVYNVNEDMKTFMVQYVRTRPDLLRKYSLIDSEKKSVNALGKNNSVKYADDDLLVQAYLQEVEDGKLPAPDFKYGPYDMVNQLFANGYNRANNQIPAQVQRTEPVITDANYNRKGFY